MAESTARRRGRGEDAIYFDPAKNRYVGAVSLGFGPDGKRIRRKVTGRTKQDVRDKLKRMRAASRSAQVPSYTSRAAPRRATASHRLPAEASRAPRSQSGRPG